MKKVIRKKFTYVFYPPDYDKKPGEYKVFLSLKEAKKAALEIGIGSKISRHVERKNIDGKSFYTDLVWMLSEHQLMNKIYKCWLSYYPHLKKSDRNPVIINSRFA